MIIRYAVVDNKGREVKDVYMTKFEGNSVTFNRPLEKGESVAIHYEREDYKP